MKTIIDKGYPVKIIGNTSIISKAGKLIPLLILEQDAELVDTATGESSTITRTATMMSFFEPETNQALIGKILKGATLKHSNGYLNVHQITPDVEIEFC